MHGRLCVYMSFNSVSENLKKGKFLDPFLKALLLSQEKSLSNLQQRVAFVYESLTKISTAMEAEKELYVAEEGKLIPLLEMSSLFQPSYFTSWTGHQIVFLY